MEAEQKIAPLPLWTPVCPSEAVRIGAGSPLDPSKRLGRHRPLDGDDLGRRPGRSSRQRHRDRLRARIRRRKHRLHSCTRRQSLRDGHDGDACRSSGESDGSRDEDGRAADVGGEGRERRGAAGGRCVVDADLDHGRRRIRNQDRREDGLGSHGRHGCGRAASCQLVAPAESFLEATSCDSPVAAAPPCTAFDLGSPSSRVPSPTPSPTPRPICGRWVQLRSKPDLGAHRAHREQQRRYQSSDPRPGQVPRRLHALAARPRPSRQCPRSAQQRRRARAPIKAATARARRTSPGGTRRRSHQVRIVDTGRLLRREGPGLGRVGSFVEARRAGGREPAHDAVVPARSERIHSLAHTDRCIL